MQFVPAKIEADSTDAEYLALKKKFKMVGVPTLLVINPADETIVKKWASELYSASPQQFIDELNGLLQQS